MDFKRVEGIFLVVFLFLNMFLFYIFQEGKDPEQFGVTGTISENLEERLRYDSIKIPGTLSEKRPQGYYLSAEERDLVAPAKERLENQEWNVTGVRLQSNLLGDALSEITSDNDTAALTDFINRRSNVIDGSDYQLNHEDVNPMKQYLFSQSWENIPFYDDTSELIIHVAEDEKEKDSGNIISYEQTYLENIEPLREQQSLISEREAVISLYTNNRLQPSSTVKWLTLGYTRIFTVRGKNVYIPAWFIAVETNKNTVQVERVNAFTSAVMSSGVSEVVN